MSTSESCPTSSRRPLGRPRRLDITQVIQAALDVGLENLSISAVAIRLGVSVAVLYTYVQNLEELRRLVVAALARRPALQENGQHWADIARARTDDVYSVLASEPALLAQLVLGAVGPDEQLEELETFLDLMSARGFDANAALDLYRTCGQIALGAAAVSTMMVARMRRGIDAETELQSLLADVPDHAYPRVRALGVVRICDGMGGDYRPALERFLEWVAQQKGEILSPPAGETDANL